MAAFEESFFSYLSRDSYYTGGKMHMMRNGYIQATQNSNQNRTPLTFSVVANENKRTPLDMLVRWLAWFCHAHWVSRYQSPKLNISVDPPGLETVPRKSAVENLTSDSNAVDTSTSDKIPAELIAKRLQDHREVLKLFDEALKKPWPTNDFVGDRTVKQESPEGQDQGEAQKAGGKDEAGFGNILEPKDMNVGMMQDPKPVRKKSKDVDLRKRRRNPTRAARPSPPEERPAKRRRCGA